MLRDEGQSNTGINGFDRRIGSKSTLAAMVSSFDRRSGSIHTITGSLSLAICKCNVSIRSSHALFHSHPFQHRSYHFRHCLPQFWHFCVIFIWIWRKFPAGNLQDIRHPFSNHPNRNPDICSKKLVRLLCFTLLDLILVNSAFKIVRASRCLICYL